MSTRLTILRRAITTRPATRWTTRRAWRLYRAHGIPQRGTARRDLMRLANEGLLTEHGPDDGRFYTPNPGARCPVCDGTFETCTCTGTTRAVAEYVTAGKPRLLTALEAPRD